MANGLNKDIVDRILWYRPPITETEVWNSHFTRKRARTTALAMRATCRAWRAAVEGAGFGATPSCETGVLAYVESAT